MIALILLKKIVSLFLILLLGFVLVRRKVLSASDSKVLSALCLYLLVPCVILSSFQVDCTTEIRNALLINVGAAVLFFVTAIPLTHAAKKPLKLSALEEMGIVYSNAGNLIIPLVSAMLGKEYVIYVCPFMAVQQILFWTHCKSALAGHTSFDWKKVLLSVNILAIMAGLILFFTGLRLPAIVEESVDSLASMVGPVSMLVSGMLIGGMPLKQVFGNRRAWGMAFLRLIALPLFSLLVMKVYSLFLPAADKNMLLVAFLAMISPCAATVISMEQVYGSNAEYASCVNVVETLCCIATMPLLAALYSMVI